jgi:glycine C-acetyltransferase
LSKGLGAFGGYTASRKEVVNLAINTSRPFIYTSALPNFMVQVGLDKFSSDREQKRIKLWKNVELYRRGLESLGNCIDSQTQIIPLIIGDEKNALDFGRFLFKNGVFAQPIRYPTVELGSARIRVSMTAWLTEEIINKSIDIFEKAGKKFRIL